MILVEVTSLACDKYDRQKEEKCGQKKDTDDRTSREPGLSLSDDSSAEGTGVSVPPEIREATDQEAQDAGPEAATEDGPGQATGGDLTGDLGHDLVLTNGAGDALSFVGELGLRSGSLRRGTLVWYLEIVLSWSTDSVD